MHDILVAIPARNEAERIGDCLRALALQQGRERYAVVVLLNNCTDASADVVRGLRPQLPCPIHLVEHVFGDAQANAGWARRLAMRRAVALLNPGGVVMTTDADARVASDWIETNMMALAAGADAVCGRAVIDPEDAALIPAHLHADDAAECVYGELLDEIHALFDPDPADPWPRHSEHSGASIAVRREMFLQAGGVPAVSFGEDRALLEALRRIDARIRHAPEVSVTVSGRLDGRARGGMADTMRRRVEQQDPLLDDRLEPAADAARRARARQQLRRLWRGEEGEMLNSLAQKLDVPPRRIALWLRSRRFGAAWALAETESPILTRQRVARRDLETQMVAAENILTAGFARRPTEACAANPAGSSAPVSVGLDTDPIP